MENPETWTDAEKVIHKALNAADQARMQGVVGLSRPRQIADALREAGLLVPKDDNPEPLTMPKEEFELTKQVWSKLCESHPEWDACRKNG